MCLNVTVSRHHVFSSSSGLLAHRSLVHFSQPPIRSVLSDARVLPSRTSCCNNPERKPCMELQRRAKHTKAAIADAANRDLASVQHSSSGSVACYTRQHGLALDIAPIRRRLYHGCKPQECGCRRGQMRSGGREWRNRCTSPRCTTCESIKTKAVTLPM